MAQHIVVVENLKDWSAEFADVTVVSARDYLMNPGQYRSRDARVINFCRNYRYLSTGYYCSLLGEARRHRVIPSVRTLTDLSDRAIYSINVDSLDERVDRALQRHYPGGQGGRFELFIFFGQCVDRELSDLARQIFDAVSCPLLKVDFRWHNRWQIQNIRPLFLHGLSDEQREFFITAFRDYLGSRWRRVRARPPLRYDLAVLFNPDEKLPPSNRGALRKFIDIGRRMGINVELVQRRDYPRLAEYDALLIRETTAIDHYTYRFAKKAEAEGMVVIDDPDSIVKCTNKVYLAELLSANRMSVPRSRILHRHENIDSVVELGYPLVLKIPDGSFSRGIYRAEDAQQLRDYSRLLFRESDLILAQEYLYTEFDWRIGVLNNEALFACQYFMSPSHWQIVKHRESGRAIEGGYQAWAIAEVPEAVVSAAVNAARLIGSGLYGVDVKFSGREAYIIEINDNPNIETGVEDAVIGDRLYQTILAEIIRRIETPQDGSRGRPV